MEETKDRKIYIYEIGEDEKIFFTMNGNMPMKKNKRRSFFSRFGYETVWDRTIKIAMNWRL